LPGFAGLFRAVPETDLLGARAGADACLPPAAPLGAVRGAGFAEPRVAGRAGFAVDLADGRGRELLVVAFALRAFAGAALRDGVVGRAGAREALAGGLLAGLRATGL
jgi:hypothetical protein